MTQKTELVALIEFLAIPGEVITCRPQIGNGAALDADTVIS